MVNKILKVLKNFEYKNLESNEISFLRWFYIIYAWCAKFFFKKIYWGYFLDPIEHT